MSEPNKRYRAFISYSQKDKPFSRRLHRALEDYRLPKGVEAGVDAKTRKLGRFFRDDEEMGAATDLGAALQGAIADAESLVVICSPNAAQSPWVNQEIIHFKRTGRADRIFAVIVAGQPNALHQERECLPHALRFALGADGALTDQPAEPLGLDFRKESFSRLLTRLVAGLLGTPFDALWKREQRRARARAFAVSLSALFGALILGGALTQNLWRPQLEAYWRYTHFAHATAELISTAPGTVFQDCAPGSRDCPRMVVLPSGEFLMPDPYGGVRKISVARFAVSETEITFDDWAACARGGGCKNNSYPLDNADWGRENRPVINVSWDDAVEYAQWLSHMTGAKYRLLSEAEWEYAARGVTSVNDPHNGETWGFGNDESQLDRYAWYRKNSGSGFQTHPVRTKRANRFGLYDMHGNVWEWVQDCLADYDRSLRDARAVETNGATCRRVLRGGSSGWASAGQTTSARLDGARTDRRDRFGVRIARQIGPPLVVAPLVEAALVQPSALGSENQSSGTPVTVQEVDAAIMANDETRIAEFLRRGWRPVTTLNGEGTTPLHRLMESCEGHHDRDPQKLVRIARMLIGAGARKDQPNRWDETPEFLAAVPRYCGPNHPVVAYLRTVP